MISHLSLPVPGFSHVGLGHRPFQRQSKKRCKSRIKAIPKCKLLICSDKQPSSCTIKENLKSAANAKAQIEPKFRFCRQSLQDARGNRRVENTLVWGGQRGTKFYKPNPSRQTTKRTQLNRQTQGGGIQPTHCYGEPGNTDSGNVGYTSFDLGNNLGTYRDRFSGLKLWLMSVSRS